MFAFYGFSIFEHFCPCTIWNNENKIKYVFDINFLGSLILNSWELLGFWVKRILWSSKDKFDVEQGYVCPHISVVTIRNIVRVIPQGTVDNNLGADRLSGLRALDPNYCRQPTLWLHELRLEVLTVHRTELRLFWAKAFPPIHTINVASDIAAVGTTFNVFSYEVVWAKNWTHNLPNAVRIRYQLCHRRYTTA